MIHKIKVENFFSISLEQSIDFKVAENATDCLNFVTSRGNHKERLPVVAGFFGANASGKTTVLRSVVSLINFILFSLSLDPDQPIPVMEPYAAEGWKEKPTRISVEFDCILPKDKKEYVFKYELAVLRRVNEAFDDRNFVSYEGLFYKPLGKWRALFEREDQTFRFGKEFGISDGDQRVNFIRPNASVLSTLAKFNHEESRAFLEYVGASQINMKGYTHLEDQESKVAAFYLLNPEFMNDLNREIRRADVGIEKVDILQSAHGPFFVFHHLGLGRPLLFGYESRGTQKFVTLFPLIKKAIDTGSVAIIDEMDSVLHPVLMEEIFSWFIDPKKNPHKAQLLFSGHNPVLFRQLEKQQIFLTEKNEKEGTIIYSVSEISGLNRNVDYTKKYLSGELGGLPIIG